MGLSVIIPVVSAVVSTGLKLHQASQQKKAAKRAAQIQQRERELEAKRERTRLLREARRRRGEQLASAATSGAFVTSVNAGFTQSLQSTLASDNSYLSEQARLGAEADAVTRKQISLDYTSNVFSSITSGLSGLKDASDQYFAGKK